MSPKAPTWGPSMSSWVCQEAGKPAWSHGCEVPVVRPDRYEEAHSPLDTRYLNLHMSKPEMSTFPTKPTLPTSFLVSVPGKFTLLVVHVTKLGSIFLFLMSPSCRSSLGSTFRGAQSWATSSPQGSPWPLPLSLASWTLPPSSCPLESLVREWPLLRSLRSHQVSAHRSRLPFPWRKVRVL